MRFLPCNARRPPPAPTQPKDDWSGPSSLGGRLLLLLGDPLQNVDIPWTPTTLVQDWTIAPASAGSLGGGGGGGEL